MSSKRWAFYIVLVIILYISIGLIGRLDNQPVRLFDTNLERIDDFLYNQKCRSYFTSQASKYFSNIGYRSMRHSNVTFMGAARDIAHNLPTILNKLESLSSAFSYSRVIIVEGDSSDNTLPILRDWSSKSKHNRTIISQSMIALLDTYSLEGTYVMRREGRISKSRNLALQHYHTLIPTEYIIVIDLDVMDWDNAGIADSFGRPEAWDVMCAHGVYLHGIYRDTYAFRMPGINTCHHLKDDLAMGPIRTAIQTSYALAKEKVHQLMDESTEKTLEKGIGKPLVPVHSCFGGLAIYKSRTFLDCEYSYRHEEEDMHHMIDCEHVLLHKCMLKKHNIKIFSNPSMKLWFGPDSWKLKFSDFMKYFTR